jgi:hypothetical protein
MNSSNSPNDVVFDPPDACPCSDAALRVRRNVRASVKFPGIF